MKTKSINFEPSIVKDDGFFSGYCNVFDVVDSYGDSVQKGAFVKSLAKFEVRGKMPPILWQHDRAQPLGVWTALKEDEHGLYGEGKLLIDDVPKAREAHALIKAGVIDGLSIGYRVEQADYDNTKEVLLLKELDLFEISVVTFPANDASTVTVVKSALAQGQLPTLSEFEKFLRDAGFSKSQATAIASYGLRQLLGEPAELKDALQIIKSITGDINV